MPNPYSFHRARKVKVPNTNTAVLTCTSKMPGPSFSLPAGRACPNAHGEICDECYAKKGCYQYTSTMRAQEARFSWVRDCMKSDIGRLHFINTMIAAIEASGVEYFRIHDSGDFFNLQYVECWIEIARALDTVMFWAPTREYQMKNPLFNILGGNSRLGALRRLAALPNVTVRPSALSIGQDAPHVDGLHAGSAVGNENAWQCPARSQGGKCGDCRHCWSRKSSPVSYPLH